MKMQHMHLLTWKQDHAKYARIFDILAYFKYVALWYCICTQKSEQSCIFFTVDNNVFGNYATIE